MRALLIAVALVLLVGCGHDPRPGTGLYFRDRPVEFFLAEFVLPNTAGRRRRH